MSAALAATGYTGTLLAGDGLGEASFVPPPREMKKPPIPPRVVFNKIRGDEPGKGR